MEYDKAEKVGKKGRPVFAHSNPSNFIFVWNNITYCVFDNKPMTTETFKDDDQQRKHLDIEIKFVASLLEKMQRYRDLLEPRK